MTKRIICLVVTAAFAFVTVAPIWGQVSITPPRASTTSTEDDIQKLVDTINTDLAGELTGFQNDLNEEIKDYYDLPKLARGVANSGGTATHIGTQRSFIDYRRFAVVVGAGVGASLPSTDPARMERIIDDLEKDGDIYFGAAIQPIVASIGYRPRILSERLFVNAKLGWSNIEEGTVEDGLAFNSLSVGLLANYRLVGSRAVPAGVLRWRGLSLGSGVVYQRNELEFRLEDFGRVDDRVTIDEGGQEAAFDVLIDPVLKATATSNSVVIPFELTTGLRVLWLLDFNVGGGVDLSFGNSEITLDVDSPVTAEDVTVNGDEITFTDGSASVSAGTEEGPQLVRPRLTAGAGLNLGPFKLDIPVMYYFDEDGNSLMAGVNLGFVW